MSYVGNFTNDPINIYKIESEREFLAHNEKFKTIYFKFEEGMGLPNHSHNGYASIQVVSGIVDMEFLTGEKFVLEAGDFLPFDARVEHNVIARELSKILVTISQSHA